MPDLFHRSPLPPRPWSLPDDPDLDWVRKQAKHLRRSAAAGDLDAWSLIAELDPSGSAQDRSPVSLARAQRVLARAFGFVDWADLRHRLDAIARWTRPVDRTPRDDEPTLDRFLRAACLGYSENQPADRLAALALLAENPELSAGSAAALAVCGDTPALAALLAADPGAARTEVGPHRWSPLLYLCYARLGLGDAVRCTEVLLAHGADPNAGFLWHGLTSPFTALTGAFGGGERGEPPHPDGSAIAERLLAAGADPNDNQTLYNRLFTPDNDFLQVLLPSGLGSERTSPWRRRLGADAYPTPAQMLGESLRMAAQKGFVQRVELLLAHGVDPNTVGYHPVHGGQTAYEVAVRAGQPAAAALLAAAGATSGALDRVDRFLSVALAGDVTATHDMLSADPGLRSAALTRRPTAILVAVTNGHDEAVALLVELGFDVDAADRFGATALHVAALEGRTAVVEVLLAAGADPTVVDDRFHATPAGWAAHAGHAELADRLTLSTRE